MATKKWQKVKTKRVYNGYRKIDVITFRLPDGELKDFDIIAGGKKTISVVGFTKGKKAILTRQYRPGPEKTFYEFCLGYAEKGESLLEAAKREFLEETCYAGQLRKIGVHYPNAYSQSEIHCYVATNCKKVTNELKLDEGEFIEVRLFSLKELKKMLKQGKVRNFSEAYLVLDHLGW